MQDKKTVHFVPEYFMHPVHPIKVHLIGAGGNGGQMLSALARINHALLALGEKGIHVEVFDPDTVESPNIGRQLFTEGDLGQNKAICLVSRFNRCFGTHWKALAEKYTPNGVPNIIISCVDNKDTRIRIGKYFRNANLTKKQNEANRGNYNSGYGENYQFYWLDLGNMQNSGQAVLGSNRIPQPESKEYDTVEYLPVVTEQFDLPKVNETDSGPSCSMAEALSKQDLFINSALVQASASLLWSLLHDAAIETRGLFINLENYRMAPIPVRRDDKLILNKNICK